MRASFRSVRRSSVAARRTMATTLTRTLCTCFRLRASDCPEGQSHRRKSHAPSSRTVSRTGPWLSLLCRTPCQAAAQPFARAPLLATDVQSSRTPLSKTPVARNQVSSSYAGPLCVRQVMKIHYQIGYFETGNAAYSIWLENWPMPTPQEIAKHPLRQKAHRAACSDGIARGRVQALHASRRSTCGRCSHYACVQYEC